MHLLEAAGARFLLDAGLFQGHRAETHELNARLPFDPRRLDGVVLSHAHIDHSGRLPLLVRHGFHGPIYATPGHARSLRGHAARRRAHPGEGPRVPAAAGQGAARERAALQPGRRHRGAGPDGRRALPPHHSTSGSISPLEFVEAGHILGSASVDLRITEGGNHRLVFSGDIGRTGCRSSATRSRRRARSTRSSSSPPTPTGTTSRWPAPRSGWARPSGGRPPAAARCSSRPSRSGGSRRSSTACTSSAARGKIPDIPIYVDSPLAVDATTVFRMHPEVFDQRERLIADRRRRCSTSRCVRYVRDVAGSKALNHAARARP